MDLELDGTGFGLGKRSQRYALVAEDGVVRSPARRLFTICFVAFCPSCVPFSACCFSVASCMLTVPNHPPPLRTPLKPTKQIKSLNVEGGGGLSCSSAQSIMSLL
jgi:hypothetical protein